MKQYGDKYAPKERKLEKSDLPKHQNRDEGREAPETSCCNSNEQSREVKEEVSELIMETYGKPPKAPKKKKAKKT